MSREASPSRLVDVTKDCFWEIIYVTDLIYLIQSLRDIYGSHIISNNTSTDNRDITYRDVPKRGES